ncbi:MAG: LysM peptidoglycan-binding domain-containing protein [Bacteroidia bacterium]|nr:LysM peptidoglycan-binding domain-containing protein [Bacteroidia bacterium]
MKEVVARRGQSLWDIAIQEFGSPDMIRQLIIDNPENLNLNDPIVVGTKIKIDDTKIVNKTIVDYLSKGGHKPATAVDVPSPMAFSSGFSLGFK